jgi:DNA-binding transcriptional regulator GbsR (MarR family)
MSQSLEEVKQELTEELTQVFDYFGFNTTAVKLYATLFFSENPLGLDELAKKTGYSKSTVCTTMELVERFFDVRRFKKPGSKRSFYECEHKPDVIINKRVNGLHLAVHSLTKALERSEKVLERDHSERRHLENITTFKESFQKVDAVLNRIPDQGRRDKVR